MLIFLPELLVVKKSYGMSMTKKDLISRPMLASSFCHGMLGAIFILRKLVQ